jgi:uncharacterized membrane protein YkoI
MTLSRNKIRNYGSGAAMLAAGLVAGGVLAGSLTANAADGPSPSPSSGTTQEQRPGETALTGDTLAKVKAAVLAKYPGATFDRVETDSDGVYEAHITKKDGTRTTVELDKTYVITGEEAGHGGPGGRGHGGPGGPGAGEAPLTGTTLSKVKAAVLKKYPGATVDRAETDNDGVYEAHITNKDGTKVTVEVNKAFEVTGEEDHGTPPAGSAPSGETQQS